MIEAICAALFGVGFAAALVVCSYFCCKHEEERERIRLEKLERFFSFLLEWKAGVVPVDQLQELFDKLDEVIKK